MARYLGFLLVEGDDLLVRDGRVYVRTIAGLKRADVILRRVDADFIDPLELNGASQLGVPGILEAIRDGGVAVLNMPGSGLLESRGPVGIPTQALPPAAGRGAENAERRDLVVRPAGGAGAGGARTGQRGHRRGVQHPGRWGTFAKPRVMADLDASRTGILSAALPGPARRFRRPGSGAPVHHAGAARGQAGAGPLRAAGLRRLDPERVSIMPGEFVAPQTVLT